jgi:predicted enzyme related to lactoylglutathione lyase
MFGHTKAYSGFSVDDIDRAREFYGETLGLKTSMLDEENGLMELHLAGDRTALVYAQPDSTAASYTILNFPVEDVEATVDGLAERGVSFERYDGFDHDEKGIVRAPGPQIAWFKDPSENVIAVLQQP